MSSEDRTCYRNLLSVTADATSPAAAGAATTTPVTGFSRFKTISFIATIQGATGGILDIIVEHSPDGTNWYEYIHFVTQTAALAAASYTYGPALNDSLVQVGKNLTTTYVLGSGSVAGSHWFDQLRVRYIAGASTSAGAAQLISVLCVQDSGQA